MLSSVYHIKKSVNVLFVVILVQPYADLLFSDRFCRPNLGKYTACFKSRIRHIQRCVQPERDDLAAALRSKIVGQTQGFGIPDPLPEIFCKAKYIVLDSIHA